MKGFLDFLPNHGIARWQMPSIQHVFLLISPSLWMGTDGGPTGAAFHALPDTVRASTRCETLSNLAPG